MKFFKPARSKEFDALCVLRPRRNRLVIFTSMTVWLLLVGTGLAFLWGYENTPGVAAKSPVLWPAESQIPRAPDKATLIMLVHPHCPCTRASIGELALLMTHSQGRLTAYVLFLQPAGFLKSGRRPISGKAPRVSPESIRLLTLTALRRVVSRRRLRAKRISTMQMDACCSAGE